MGTHQRSLLVGDHIETQGNVDCLQATAAMFDWDFAQASNGPAPHRLPIIALENTRGAESLFHYHPPEGPVALVVGNERKGISRSWLRRADRVVQIPVPRTQEFVCNKRARFRQCNEPISDGSLEGANVGPLRCATGTTCCVF